jgi:GT2 family glycosyltransferase
MNHRELERDYWNALRKEECEVLVIDNASDPPLPNAFRLEENAGFSGASNIGLRMATTDAVLFLNNDIFASEAGWMDKIRMLLEPGVLVGPKLRFDAHGDVAGERLPYLDGWCLAGMRDDLLELGGFDETYEEPAYYSDNDLCFRARLEGMTLREVRCGIHHKGGATSEANGYTLPSTTANRAKYQQMVNEALTEVR